MNETEPESVYACCFLKVPAAADSLSIFFASVSARQRSREDKSAAFSSLSPEYSRTSNYVYFEVSYELQINLLGYDENLQADHYPDIMIAAVNAEANK